MRRVFLDTETTGFGADKNRIVSVGAVAYNDRDIISGDGGEFDCYVNPPCAMEEGAQKTHGLSEEFSRLSAFCRAGGGYRGVCARGGSDYA